MNNLKKAIQERIQENERHARSLRSQSRHRPRRLNKELNWVLDLINKDENDFARTIMFIYTRSRNKDFIYSSDLSEFLKVSTSRANQILNDFVNVGLLKKSKNKKFCEIIKKNQNGKRI